MIRNRLLQLFIALGVAMLALPAAAERIKDLATIQGVRDNQLIGYGVVVGLDGTGDQTTQAPFTSQSVISMLSQMGVSLPPGTSPQLKNVAAVVVTASLPAFAQPGQRIDVTVSSIGNAKSLRGGTLLMTPLKGADGQIYAIAQGNMLVVGAGGQGAGSSVQVNHLSAGRIPDGGTVERAVPMTVGQGGHIVLELKDSDFHTASRIVEAINRDSKGQVAQALDGRRIAVQAPLDSNQRVAFVGRVENLNVRPAAQAARVIVNSRTGSVVMNQAVRVDVCAVAHGNLAVVVSATNAVSQPGALSGGQTAATSNADVQISSDGGGLLQVPQSANLSDVVNALNAMGAKPQELLAILQAMKAAGALRAELEVI